MNYYLLISGILTILTGIAHSIIGEKLIISPIQKTEGLPSRTTKLTLRFTWHVTTVLGLGTAFILLYYCKKSALSSDEVFVLRILSLTYFVCFLVSVIGSRARHPSWIILIIVSVLSWVGTYP